MLNDPPTMPDEPEPAKRQKLSGARRRGKLKATLCHFEECEPLPGTPLALATESMRIAVDKMKQDNAQHVRRWKKRSWVSGKGVAGAELDDVGTGVAELDDVGTGVAGGGEAEIDDAEIDKAESVASSNDNPDPAEETIEDTTAKSSNDNSADHSMLPIRSKASPGRPFFVSKR